MNMYEIITKKKQGLPLTAEEIGFFVSGVTDGSIPDYQTSALLMAICLKGMDDEETFLLTDAMTHSGDTLDLSAIEGIKADKHSTGGVGDKTTLVLAPMLACCGLKVAKMSGRGLGHTGGTIDKLESIPGFSTSMSDDDFIRTVREHGITVVGQTADLAPADKKLYALRDVTATIDNISLITSSIMSKKLACGADCLVLDVKTGSGAFMKTVDDARQLGRKMVDIGRRAGKKVGCVISDMNQPLGTHVGNAIEVNEAVETLRGRGSEDLRHLCLVLGSVLLVNAGIAKDRAESESMLSASLDSGRALSKFMEFVTAQGGDTSVFDGERLLPVAPLSMDVLSPADGYVSSISCADVGMASLLTGAGRETKDDVLDLSAGLIVYRKVGDRVRKGDAIATVYSSDGKKLESAAAKLLDAYEFSQEETEPLRLIHEIIM
ncbi:MAG: pyrimidine-nucleoside phosphorylase [Eubacteriaceae bacterium]|nr:pyrimidine-nucleoside phosphorylase [Eubacteriaceae bacterium]